MSIDIKTKVVQHVPGSTREIEGEREREGERGSQLMSDVQKLKQSTSEAHGPLSPKVK